MFTLHEEEARSDASTTDTPPKPAEEAAFITLKGIDTPGMLSVRSWVAQLPGIFTFDPLNEIAVVPSDALILFPPICIFPDKLIVLTSPDASSGRMP